MHLGHPGSFFELKSEADRVLCVLFVFVCVPHGARTADSFFHSVYFIHSLSAVLALPYAPQLNSQSYSKYNFST
jgi:hypothetical protein